MAVVLGALEDDRFRGTEAVEGVQAVVRFCDQTRGRCEKAEDEKGNASAVVDKIHHKAVGCKKKEGSRPLVAQLREAILSHLENFCSCYHGLDVTPRLR